MIHMPHRNVTRFFIPLIDVLILLFCIFLLMDFNAESKVDEQSDVVEDKIEDIQQLDSDRRRLSKEYQESEKQLKAKIEELNKKLQVLENLNPDKTEMSKLLRELAELKKEVERLQKASQQSLQDRSFFKIIDINRKDGSISYYDETRKDDPIISIHSEDAAEELIERHRKQAKTTKKSDVYYYFVRTRPSEEDRKLGKLKSAFPVVRQINQYKTWFAKVANNLAEYN